MNGYSTCSVVATQENITDLLYFLKERGFVTSTVSLDYLVRNPQCKYLNVFVSRDERKASLQSKRDTTLFYSVTAFKCHIIDNFPPNFSVLIKNTEDAENLIKNYSQFFKDRDFDISSFTLDAYNSKNGSKVLVPFNYLTTNKKGDNKSLCFTSATYKNWTGRILCKSADEFLNKIAEHYKITENAQTVEASNKVESTKIYSIDFRAEYLRDKQGNILYSWESFVKYVIMHLESILSPTLNKEHMIEQLLELSDSDFVLNLYLQDGIIIRWMRSDIVPIESFTCYCVGDFRKKLKESSDRPSGLIPLSSFYLEENQDEVVVKSILPPKVTIKNNSVEKENSTIFTPLVNGYKLLLRRKRRRCS